MSNDNYIASITSPKIQRIIYEYLCHACRYEWVYLDYLPHCTECGSHRIKTVGTRVRPIYFDDYSIKFEYPVAKPTSAIIVISNTSEMPIPYDQEFYQNYLARVIVYPGRLFTPTKFVSLIPVTPLYEYQKLDYRIFGRLTGRN